MPTRHRLGMLLVLLTAFSLLAMSLPVGAAPPGSDSYQQTQGWGHVTEVRGFTQVEADFNFDTNEYGENMSLAMSWSAFDGSYYCQFNTEGLYGATFEVVDDPATSHLTFTVSADDSVLGWPLDGGCGDGLVEAVLVVDYSAARQVRWHLNETGQQCRGIDQRAWNEATAWLYIDTVDIRGIYGESLMSGTVESEWATYVASEWSCHLTGTPGKP